MLHTFGVIVASAGRPTVLAETLEALGDVVDETCQLVVSVPDEASVPTGSGVLDTVDLVVGRRGLPAQRNSGIDALDESVRYVAFFDDDAIPHRDYLSAAMTTFRQRPDVVGVTGQVLYDGVVTGRPCDAREARTILDGFRTPDSAATPCSELYGCNFVVRREVLDEHRFDERLPLYGWLEDLDFSRRIGRLGDLMSVTDAAVVHRGVTSGGRMHGLRLGYSQVVNPVYLAGKRSISYVEALALVTRPMAKNLMLSMAAIRCDSRRARMRGNLIGLADIARRQVTPERAAEFRK